MLVHDLLPVEAQPRIREMGRYYFDLQGAQNAKDSGGSYRPKLVTAGIGKAAYRGGA